MRPSARARGLFMVAILAALVVPANVSGRDDAILLDGDSISVGRAAELSCHDLEAGVIRCYRTSAEMRAAIVHLVRTVPERAAAVLATGYVIVYEDAGFGGASRTLSVDYANLSSIGWNDRISSFVSFGASGHFREHSPAGGFLYGYGSTTSVSSLSGTYNDKFSLFEIS